MQINITHRYSSDQIFSHTVENNTTATTVQTAINALVSLEFASLTNADLSNVNFNSSNLYLANFAGCNLTNANLSGCNLTMCNFSGSNLTNANLTNCNLTNIVFDKHTILLHTIF